MTCLIRLVLVLAGFAALAMPASAQQSETPPAPMWRLESNGDAVHSDLGFILPPRWQGFERTGFTSTRPDGASVMAHYRRTDGPLKLGILIQLRADVRGFSLPGADGVERNWRFIQSMGAAAYPGGAQPEELAGDRIVWGNGDRPNARMQLRRYRLADRDEIQGLWYRNIGLWAVVIQVSGPADRRADIEAAGRGAMTGIQWPAAPLTAEINALAPQFPRDLPECGSGLDRAGTGQPIDPGPAISALIGTGLSVYFLDTARTLPHPVLDRSPYCRIETFRVGSYEVIALGWRGDHAGFPAARYAFMLAGHDLFFQFEGLFHFDGLAEAERRGIRRPVWLTLSGPRKVELLAVLSDWPSYERAKEIIVAIGQNRRTPPLVEIHHPPGRIHAIVNHAGETPAPPATPQ